MTRRLAVDASVVVKVFSPHEERHADRALALLGAWETGQVEFVAPDLLTLEVFNVAARKWQLAEPALLALAAALGDMGMDVRRADPARVAHWAAQGLTAYDAAYVAVAEAARVPLVTDDDQLVALAAGVAVPLGSDLEL